MKGKTRKRKAADALKAPAPPADTPAAGLTEDKPLEKKKKPKASFEPQKPAAGGDLLLAASSQHLATEQLAAVVTQKANRAVKEKPSKKRQAKAELQAPSAASTDAAEAAEHQIARKQAPRSGSHIGGSSSAHMAADLDEDADAEGDQMDDDLSADEEGSMAEDPPGAAGGAATRPRLTEEQRAERLQRTVFIGNLPAAVKAKHIKQAFSRCALAPISPLHACAFASLSESFEPSPCQHLQVCYTEAALSVQLAGQLCFCRLEHCCCCATPG